MTSTVDRRWDRPRAVASSPWKRRLRCCLLPALLLGACPSHGEGLLRVHPQNPRYFTDDGTRAIYLTGSHEGWELQDRAWDDPRVFDFDAYLDFLGRNHMNVIRMWVVEHTRSRGGSASNVATPMPFLRTGPGEALDGRPKFDLERLDPSYFDRLRARVVAARERDIYVIVMLFQGVSIWDSEDFWFGHYLNEANNVQGIDGDENHDGKGFEAHRLRNQAVLRVQEAYVRKVVETVGDLDNVLWEVANEDREGSVVWQRHWIAFLRQLEANRPLVHPIGMTFRGRNGTNEELFASDADWISVRGADSLRDPQPTDGRKVVLLDTDHFKPYTRNATFPWRALMRGHNPIILDRLDDLSASSPFDGIRSAMAEAARLAETLDLERLVPRPELATSGFCLADLERELIVYLPSGRVVDVDLKQASGAFFVDWKRPDPRDSPRPTRVAKRIEVAESELVAGGGVRRLRAPFADGAILRLFKEVPPTPGPCAENETTKCLVGGRFELTGSFLTRDGTIGRLSQVKFSDNTTLAYFNNDSNIEILGKVLNGCAINGHWWVFLGGVTDQGITVSVRDSKNGRVYSYTNPLGTKFLTDTQTLALPCQ